MASSRASKPSKCDQSYMSLTLKTEQSYCCNFYLHDLHISFNFCPTFCCDFGLASSLTHGELFSFSLCFCSLTLFFSTCVSSHKHTLTLPLISQVCLCSCRERRESIFNCLHCSFSNYFSFQNWIIFLHQHKHILVVVFSLTTTTHTLHLLTTLSRQT